MNTFTIPPAVQNNCINPLIAAPDGTLIYISRMAIVISKPNDVESDPKDFQMIYKAHQKNRINGIAIDPKNWGYRNKYIASCGDDNYVHLWNADDLSLKSGHKGHVKSTNQSDRCIDIAFYDNFIISITEFGQMITWCVRTNTVKEIIPKFKIAKIKISALAICPHKIHLCAVSTYYGIIFILNVKNNGEIVQSLAMESSQISSISFSPYIYNISKLETVTIIRVTSANAEKGNMEMEEVCETKPTFLLAAASSTGLVSVWRIGDEISLQTSINLKQKSNVNKKLNQNKLDYWSLIVKWASVDQLYVSSSDGRLLIWKIENAPSIRSCTLVCAEHTKPIFAIGSLCFDEADDSLLAMKFKKDPYVWTAGCDRVLCCFSLNSKNILYKYSTFSGALYEMISLSLDPSKLIICSGDMTLKSLNLSQPHKTCITMRILRSENSKIIAVLWHPEKENVFVFSTDYRLGLINPDKSTKVTYFKQTFKDKIYCMAWGPLLTSENNRTNRKLYVCGDGNFGFIDITKPDEGVTLLTFEESTRVISLSWKFDYSMCAVGCSSGKIIFMSPDHKVIKTIYDQKHKIYSLKWHPKISDFSQECPNWLASASNDGIIMIYNCLFQSDNLSTEQYAKIEAHTSLICSVAWSPHENGKLASTSYDNTIKVWDVFTKTLIAMYHCYDHALCVLWSNFNPDLIHSGSRDGMFCTWSVKENNPNKKQIEINKKRDSVKLLSLSNKEIKNEPKVVSVASKEIISETATQPKSILLSAARYQNNSTTILDAIKRQLRNCDNSSEDTFICDKLFGSENDVLTYLNYEREKHMEQNRRNSGYHIFVWQGNVKEMIDKACEAKQLTPQLVSYAPMISNIFWRKTCIHYAQQIQEDNVLVACSYYLMANEIAEAVDVLCNGKMFREALALIKIRLPENESGANDIIRKWAQHTSKEGAYEIAAQCYVHLKDFNNAALLLSRRKEINSLKLAFELAQLANNHDLSEALKQAIQENHNSETDENKTPQDIPLPSRLDMPDVKSCILKIKNVKIDDEAN